jgi:hypothetical protein
MKTSLTEILEKELLNKKIKLYKVLEKTHNPQGIEYYLTDKDELSHPKSCTIIGESFGFINSINTEYDKYDGDYYNIIIVDENQNPLHVNGLYSITSKLEILDNE